MPFSNDEQIPVEEKSKLKSVVLIVAVGLFLLSLFNVCFCTGNACRTSIEAFLLGWLAMLTGGAAITWLANPFLIVAWILLSKKKNASWIFGLLASVLSIMFLKFDVIIENEAGHRSPIVSIQLGYWLWLSSCSATFIGSLIIRISKFRSVISST
jgi:hypothetical protein